MRRLCWDFQEVPDVNGVIADFLSAGGARNWQRELVVPALSAALSQPDVDESAADGSVDLL